MVEAIKIIRVFIGSPGGLDVERQAAKRVIDEVNQNHGEHWSCQFKLVGWEATLPGYSRAQSLINQDLDKCDYFAGVIWNRWGSKPDDGDCKYSSGFEEEFERAKERIGSGLMKDIALFFKAVPDVQLNDPGESLKRVLEFREKCIAARRRLFKEFNQVDEFESLFRAKIDEIGWNEFHASMDEERGVIDSELPSTVAQKDQEVTSPENRLIGTSSANFIGDLLERPADWDATDSIDIARFRLIASSMARTGNDEMYLGSHDANLLFFRRAEIDFDERETNALIDTGVVGFHHQNVPLWYWLAASANSGNLFDRVKVLAITGNEHEKANGIRILQSAKQKTPSLDEYFNRDRVLRSWLLDGASDRTFNAAVSFLKTNGDADDLGIVVPFLDMIVAARRSALATVILMLSVAKDLNEGFSKLIQLDPDTIAEAEVGILFASPKSLSSEVLARCLKLKSELIRRSAAELLYARKEIDVETAETLLADSDIEIRLIAVESLLFLGKPLPDESVRVALARPRSSSLGATRSDQNVYEKYQQNRLAELSFGELVKRVENSGALDRLEVRVLGERHTKRYLSEIRNDLADQYKSHFGKGLAKWISLYQEDSKLVSDARNLEGFIRKELTLKSLDALCIHSDPQDLKLVRKTLDEFEVRFSEKLLKFLAKHGDWSDRNRVLDLATRYSGRTLLTLASDDRANFVAFTLYSLGKSRLLDLLRLKVSVAVRRAILMRLSQKDVAGLSDALLIEQLINEDDQARKILAIKCSLALPQTRLRELLGKYMRREEQRYYNCMHWLDLGVSLPRKVAKAVATFELERMAS